MASRSIEQIIERQIRHWDRVAATLRYDPSEPKAPSQAEVSHQPVICISRDLGSGEGEVVETLASEINYKIMGKEIIDHIAVDLNVQRRIVDSRDERFHTGAEALIDSMLKGRDVDNPSYLSALIRVVRGIALRGGVILLGRGAGEILGDEAPLRVRIIAPMRDRIRRLAAKREISEDEARAQIERSDRERAQFIRKHFRVDRGDPTHSDLTLNTSRIPPAKCPAVIIGALRARGYQIDPHREI
ncbi:cytidylate kinase-like family protein [Candidatus Sumerlaeota bacterium]|nr:cytidylate kinase-like family protein [Candidatus Sumerlaeota bacterium]